LPNSSGARLAFSFRFFIDLHLPAGLIGLQGRFPQCADLVVGQMPEAALRKIAQHKRSGLDPLEPDNRTADVIEHATHLAFPALMDRDLDPGIHLLFADLSHPGRCGLAILQEHALFKHADLAVGEHSLYLGKVRLGELVLGVGDQMRKVTVVGQEQKTFRIVIQPPHRVDPHLDALQQIVHHGPALRIGHGRDESGRFVQHDVGRRLLGIDQFAVHLDVIFRGISLGPQLGDHLTVHAHSAFGYKLFRGSAGCDPGGRYDLLQTF
jgi:hypothetical protein